MRKSWRPGQEGVLSKGQFRPVRKYSADHVTIFILQYMQFTEENTYIVHKNSKILQISFLYLTWFYSYSYL